MIGKTSTPKKANLPPWRAPFAKRRGAVRPQRLPGRRTLPLVLWGPGENLPTSRTSWSWSTKARPPPSSTNRPPRPKPASIPCTPGWSKSRFCRAQICKFVELQSWGKHVWNFSHERVRVERDANLDWIFGAIGSRLTKNFSELDLAGQGAVRAACLVSTFTDGNQHLDHDTQQNHLAPTPPATCSSKARSKAKAARSGRA
jgi:hypothetical protein